MDDKLAALVKRVERLGPRGSNALDVEVEVALFEPHDDVASVRANAAGTKVIYSYTSGEESTHWAREWTNPYRRESTIAALRALAQEQDNERG